MCGRYISVQTIETIEKRFNLAPTGDIGYQPTFNLGPGKMAPVITNENPKQLQMFQFGLTPFWAKKQMYLFNARTEGDRNKENDTNYTGARDIITKPAFRKPIRQQRCLVIADAFFEGPETEKLNKPYLVYLKEKKRPFAFAGIWDIWKNEEGMEIYSFAIITTVANKLMQQIGHPRSPVILSQRQEQKWLNSDAPLADITAMLNPFDSEFMNAYPVSPEIKNPKAEGRELIEPIGQRIFPENDMSVHQTLKLQGMGHGKRKFKDDWNISGDGTK